MAEEKKKETVTPEVEPKQEPSPKAKKNKYKELVAERDKEIYQLKEKLLREAAELENFKKRMQTERINERKFASKNLITDLLVHLDHLKIAVNMTTEDATLKNFLIGFKMISDSLYKVLEDDGLKEIDALNKQFDPKFHHAVEKEHENDKPNGINLKVVSKGYTYKDQLLRPAMVVVNEWSDENGKDE
eukprot:Anaeramoba_ignava/a348318_40.p3 GENE.a348318_40~~a348318_40.p3  ORF type:complete len:188 (+),score=44.77 a348318_40:1049-1612(+)